MGPKYTARAHSSNNIFADIYVYILLLFFYQFKEKFNSMHLKCEYIKICTKREKELNMQKKILYHLAMF